MQAGFRKVHRLGIGKLADFEGLHAVEKRPARVLAVGILVAERPRLAAVVPLLAAGDAGVAADTDVQVDDQSELFRRHSGEILTGTSYQPACPVMGSELDDPSGSRSESTLLRMNPRVTSFASGARPHAPGDFPMAFQVQTVPGSTASL